MSHNPSSSKKRSVTISIRGNTKAVDTEITAAYIALPTADIKLWVANASQRVRYANANNDSAWMDMVINPVSSGFTKMAVTVVGAKNIMKNIRIESTPLTEKHLFSIAFTRL